ncbi:MAG: ribbon-helix-helix protein, CopG family [Acidobacteria bacterium]|nr:ribbon-helix-helix protein, CopG family [Acidobacteriota bacterium]
MAASCDVKQIVTVRIPAAIVTEVRRIAEREGESTSTIVRRLLREAVEAERAEAR